MEEVTKNVTHDEVLELIKDFPVQPLRNRLIITTNVEEEDELDLDGSFGFAEAQYVVAEGSSYDEIKPGCKVLLDLAAMSINTQREDGGGMTFAIQLKPLKVNGRVYGIIGDRYVDAVDNR